MGRIPSENGMAAVEVGYPPTLLGILCYYVSKNQFFIKRGKIGARNGTTEESFPHCISGSSADSFHILRCSTYFVLGYYLHKVELSGKLRQIIYILGIAGYIATVLTTYLASQQTLSPNHNYYSEFTVNNFL